MRSSNSASDHRDSLPSEHAGGLRQSFGLALTGSIPTIIRLWKQWRIGSFKYSIISKVIEQQTILLSFAYGILLGISISSMTIWILYCTFRRYILSFNFYHSTDIMPIAQMRKLRSRIDLDSKEQGRDLKSGVSIPKTYALLLGIKFSQCRSYLLIVANS